MKHVQIKFHFVWDLIKNNKIELEYRCTKLMIADIFMKPLPPLTHTFHAEWLGIGLSRLEGESRSIQVMRGRVSGGLMPDRDTDGGSGERQAETDGIHGEWPHHPWRPGDVTVVCGGDGIGETGTGWGRKGWMYKRSEELGTSSLAFHVLLHQGRGKWWIA
jgi:hypothetical protein